MRRLMFAISLAMLVPATGQAQVQFVPYNPGLPPFRAVTFTRDLFPPILVNPVPQSQVFVIVDANDLLVRRSIVDAAPPVVADSNYAVNAALASVNPGLVIDRSAIVPASISPATGVAPASVAAAANQRAPIVLATNAAAGRDPNDARYQGWFVAAEGDIAERLRLTAAQKAEVEKAIAEKDAGIRNAANDSDEANRQFMSKRRMSRERFLRMLTPEQQQMWTALTGDPYEFRPNW